MSLMEELAGEMALDTQRKTLLLMTAGGRIRMAEYLEALLRRAGLYAKAVARTASDAISVHVTVYAAADKVADVLCERDIYFDVSKAPGTQTMHFDCNVGSYNVILLVLPPVDQLLEQVA